MNLLQRKYGVFALFILMIIVRFWHFGETVDLPHNWRQYDTKQYIEGYYYDNAPFTQPTVCWMGDHKTLVLEYPLPEYLVAQLYKVFGPHLWVARAFFLLFFALSAVYFYKALRLVFDQNYVPEIATAFYGFAPLSLFYSRAIHIDFFALAFAFAMLYFLLKAVKSQSMKWFVVSVICASIAFLVKAPYVFYLALPVLVVVFREKQFKWLLLRSAMFILPVALLVWWNRYSQATNERIPDWYFIPSFNKFTDMWYWYFGTMEQRMQLANWTTIAVRILEEITGVLGLVLVGIGVIFTRKDHRYWFAMLWFVGTVVYAFIFFNLNVHHDYYQLPFVASLAILSAMGVQWIIDRVPAGKAALVAGVMLPVIGAVESFRYAETHYYSTEPQFDKIAAEVRKHTKRSDRVIVAFGGLSPQCPLILQPAGRYGWSIPEKQLNLFVLRNLIREGKANRLAIVYDGYFTGEFQQFFEAQENKVGIPIDKKGKALYLCDLKPF